MTVRPPSRRRRTRTLGIGLAALVLSVTGLAACGGGGGDQLSGGSSGDTNYTLAQAQNLPASPTLDKIRGQGRIVIGTKFDQPLFGLKNPANGQIEGFDTEVGRLLALYLLGDKNKVEFIETVSKNREPFLQEGRVQAVIATYTINDQRKQQVGFAGPYYLAGQDIMVKKDNDSIKSVQDLNGKKVATVSGSTSEKNVREKAPQAQVQLYDTYSQAAEALADGRADAETTDNVILLGLINQRPDDFKLVGNPFTQEPYGIGVPKDDTVFRNTVNDFLQAIFTNGDWTKASEATAGKVDEKTPQPPALDRY
jgi:glutamate transport system substrate-binding protein